MFVYTKFWEMLAGGGNFVTDVFKVLLERSTSTYVPNIDHDFLNDFTGGGGVEITVPSYTRLTFAGKTNAADNVNDRLLLGASNLAFGNLEAGQTVKAVLAYRQVGGSDATPADDELMFYYDGTMDVCLAVDSSVGGSTNLWVDKLPAPLADNTPLNFAGSAVTSTAAFPAGARLITTTNLSPAKPAGTFALNVPIDGNILPFPLGGGAFNITLNAAGLMAIKKPSGV